MIPLKQLLEVKELAGNATQGEWFYIPYIRAHGIASKTGADHRKYRLATCPPKHGKDAEYIAYANPQFVQSLIDEVIESRRVVGFYSKCDGYCASDECVCSVSKASEHLAKFGGVE